MVLLPVTAFFRCVHYVDKVIPVTVVDYIQHTFGALGQLFKVLAVSFNPYADKIDLGFFDFGPAASSASALASMVHSAALGMPSVISTSRVFDPAVLDMLDGGHNAAGQRCQTGRIDHGQSFLSTDCLRVNGTTT